MRKWRIPVALTREKIERLVQMKLSDFSRRASLSAPYDGVLEVEPDGLGREELGELARRVAPFVPREFSVVLRAEGEAFVIEGGEVKAFR